MKKMFAMSEPNDGKERNEVDGRCGDGYDDDDEALPLFKHLFSSSNHRFENWTMMNSHFPQINKSKKSTTKSSFTSEWLVKSMQTFCGFVENCGFLKFEFRKWFRQSQMNFGWKYKEFNWKCHWITSSIKLFMRRLIGEWENWCWTNVVNCQIEKSLINRWFCIEQFPIK